MSEPMIHSESAAADEEPLPSVAPVEIGIPRSARNETGGDWLNGLQWLSSTIVIALFVITFLAQAFQIPSESMENTLLIGDYLLVDKSHYGTAGDWNWLIPYSDVKRGDIIVFRYPVNPTQHFVKRVIAVPGDRLRLFHGKVFVNDKAVDDSRYAIHKNHDFDSYRDNFPDGNFIGGDVNSRWWVELHSDIQGGELVVPADDYFVLGDNRDQSLDSRYWGFVPRSNIVGRPLLIYWSVERPDEPQADGKLERLLYALVHLPADARWDRAFHLVR